MLCFFTWACEAFTYIAKNLHEVTGYTSRLVLHHNSSSVNYSVYLQYGFIATSEPQKNFITKRPGLVITILKIDFTLA